MGSSFCWQSATQKSTARFSLQLAAFASLVTLALVTPVYFLGLGLAKLTAIAKGMNPFSFGLLADPVIWLPLFGTSGLAGLATLFLVSRRTITAFNFDSKTGRLNYVETAPLRKPRTTVVPFEFIRSVTPMTLTTLATVGHLAVVTRLPEQDERSLWLGSDISLESLQAHCTWLSRYLGDRVQPLMRQDC